MRKEKQYHYIYKTTDLRNGNFYIGAHSTNDLNDGYLGSGTRLRRAIKKHGKDKFNLEILEYFDSRKLLMERESEIVNLGLIKDEKCMNLKPGGRGGFSIENARKGGYAAAEILRDKWASDSKWGKYMIGRLNNGRRKAILDGRMKRQYNPWPKGKLHTDAAKKKMSESSKGQGLGTSNSQYGTCWITNGTENKKINKEDNITEGWNLGRFIGNKKIC